MFNKFCGSQSSYSRGAGLSWYRHCGTNMEEAVTNIASCAFFFFFQRKVCWAMHAWFLSNALLHTQLNTRPAGSFPVQPNFTVSLLDPRTTVIFCCSPLSWVIWWWSVILVATLFSQPPWATGFLHFPECLSKTRIFSKWDKWDNILTGWLEASLFSVAKFFQVVRWWWMSAGEVH